MTSLYYGDNPYNTPRRTVSLKLTPMNSGNLLSYLQNSPTIGIMDITTDDLDICYYTHSAVYINEVTIKLYNYHENQEITLEHVDYYTAFFCLYLCYDRDKNKKILYRSI